MRQLQLQEKRGGESPETRRRGAGWPLRGPLGRDHGAAARRAAARNHRCGGHHARLALPITLRLQVTCAASRRRAVSLAIALVPMPVHVDEAMAWRGGRGHDPTRVRVAADGGPENPVELVRLASLKVSSQMFIILDRKRQYYDCGSVISRILSITYNCAKLVETSR